MQIPKLAVIPVVLIFCTSCKTARLVEPDPIPIGVGDSRQAREIIGKALVRRGWVISSEAPGKIIITRVGGAWTAAAQIEYDAGSARISYVDSSNLRYRKTKKGREYIHRNYNVWTKRLAEDIRILRANALK